MKKQLLVFIAIMFLVGCVAESSIQEVSFQDLKFKERPGDAACYEFNHITFFPTSEFSLPNKEDQEYFSQGIIIRNEQEYQKLNEFKLKKDHCAEKSLPEIDFDTKTLLGNFKNGNCATKEFERKITANHGKKEYTYEVNRIDEEIGCTGIGLRSMNWITVDKIPEDYTVVFS